MQKVLLIVLLITIFGCKHLKLKDQNLDEYGFYIEDCDQLDPRCEEF